MYCKLTHPLHLYQCYAVTASHLPEDKNGVKFFSKVGGLSKDNIDELIGLAQDEARNWYDTGVLPPSSGNNGVLCSELVSFDMCNRLVMNSSLAET